MDGFPITIEESSASPSAASSKSWNQQNPSWWTSRWYEQKKKKTEVWYDLVHNSFQLYFVKNYIDLKNYWRLDNEKKTTLLTP